eukprot:3511512-Pyramimonas_sp.AAC.1
MDTTYYQRNSHEWAGSSRWPCDRRWRRAREHRAASSPLGQRPAPAGRGERPSRWPRTRGGVQPEGSCGNHRGAAEGASGTREAFAVP